MENFSLTQNLIKNKNSSLIKNTVVREENSHIISVSHQLSVTAISNQMKNEDQPLPVAMRNTANIIHPVKRIHEIFTELSLKVSKKENNLNNDYYTKANTFVKKKKKEEFIKNDRGSYYSNINNTMKNKFNAIQNMKEETEINAKKDNFCHIHSDANENKLNDEDKLNEEENRHKGDLLNFKQTLNITKNIALETKKILDEDTIICEDLNKKLTTSKHIKIMGKQEQTCDDVYILLSNSKINSIVRK